MTFFRLLQTAPKALLVAVVLWPGRATAWAQDKKPVPDAAAQAKAQELIRDVYGKQLEVSKTSAEKTGLAKKLLDQAAKSKGDPASHFVLLRIAKEVAVLAGDAETALEAVDPIIQTYEVDPAGKTCQERMALPLVV